MSNTKIFIGGLPDDCTHADIETILKHKDYSDDIVRSFEINLVRDRTTDKFKGFAYVDVKSEERVEELLKLDGASFADKHLRVDRATPKTNTRRGGRGEHHGGRPRGGDSGRGGGRGSCEFGRGGGSGVRGGFHEGRGGRDGRKNSERRGSGDEDKHDDKHDVAPKPSGRPRLQLQPLTTDPAAIEAKKKRDAEEEAQRRAKLFQA